MIDTHHVLSQRHEVEPSVYLHTEIPSTSSLLSTPRLAFLPCLTGDWDCAACWPDGQGSRDLFPSNSVHTPAALLKALLGLVEATVIAERLESWSRELRAGSLQAAGGLRGSWGGLKGQRTTAPGIHRCSHICMSLMENLHFSWAPAEASCRKQQQDEQGRRVHI